MGDKSQTAMIGRLLLQIVVFFLLVSLIFILGGGGGVNGQPDPQINITFIHDAVAKGAVCLDGSPGAYYFDKGFGDGVDNWVIYLPGGGWCNTTDECLKRTTTPGGATNFLGVQSKYLYPILTPNINTNPDFYNWNRVFIRYCDGASFMADIEAVDPETNLHFRGRRIFNTVMEELITQGMSNAANALLVGDSAGGLATILNCDRFRSFLSFDVCRVKCISDSGFFIQAKEDLPGATYREEYFANVAALHELAEFLPKSCTKRMALGLCLFPENVVNDIEMPLFLLNSDFDQFQISKLLVPNPPENVGWKSCTDNSSTLIKCTANQFHLITDFYAAFRKTLEKLDGNPSRGLFISSCYLHDFIFEQSLWQGTPTLLNKTIQQALGDWYFDRSNVQLIDTQPHPIACGK